MLAQSEQARADLQDHIQAIADKVHADTEASRLLQDDLNRQIAAHAATIQRMHEEAARTKQAHLN